MYSCGYNFRLPPLKVRDLRLDLGKNISFSDTLLGMRVPNYLSQGVIGAVWFLSNSISIFTNPDPPQAGEPILGPSKGGS